MTGVQPRRRGQPLFVLGMIMLSWIGARAALWQSDRGAATAVPPQALVLASADSPRIAALPVSTDARPAIGPSLPWPTRQVPEVRVAVAERPVAIAPAVELPLPPLPLAALAASPARPAIAPGLAGGHAVMWLAVVSRMPSPEVLLAAAAATRPAVLAAPASSALQRQPAPAERRWSGDAWALFRSGGGSVGAGPSIATYGGSQVGAVLRYRLMPGNPHKPAAYLRASAALNGSGEREAAVGLSARPVGTVPIVVAAEGRVGQLGGRSVVRPAVMAVTEVAPFALPQQARAEFYLQAGYVGGAGATPFIDGQLRVDRQIGRVGPVEVRAGAGVWGGVQRGAGRLDVGPSATLGVARGQASARVGLDWRFRIKGEAEPSSGPALTISAGF